MAVFVEIDWVGCVFRVLFRVKLLIGLLGKLDNWLRTSLKWLKLIMGHICAHEESSLGLRVSNQRLSF